MQDRKLYSIAVTLSHEKSKESIFEGSTADFMQTEMLVIWEPKQVLDIHSRVQIHAPIFAVLMDGKSLSGGPRKVSVALLTSRYPSHIKSTGDHKAVIDTEYIFNTIQSLGKTYSSTLNCPVDFIQEGYPVVQGATLTLQGLLLRDFSSINPAEINT